MPSYPNSGSPSAHEVLAAVLRVRGPTPPPEGRPAMVQVLLWRRALEPHIGRWSLPGGWLRADEDAETSIRRQLAEKVDLGTLTHVEQLGVFSTPGRVPGPRVVATAFLGLVPSDVDPVVPADTAWHNVAELPRTAFDHGDITRHARDRLRAKLSYTNLGFALVGAEFTLSALSELYSAALGYRVSATNLQRVLSRRGVLEPCGRTAPPGPGGGRPASLYRFAHHDLRITDPFAVFKPPASGEPRPAAPRARTRERGAGRRE